MATTANTENTGNSTAIIVLALVVIAAIILGVLFLGNGGDSSSVTSTVKEAPAAVGDAAGNAAGAVTNNGQ